MAQASGELADYVKRVGEHINLLYNRLGKIDEKLGTISRDINELKNAVERNRNEIDGVRESTVLKKEFSDFVDRLTESFKELLPPVPKQAEELDREA